MYKMLAMLLAGASFLLSETISDANATSVQYNSWIADQPERNGIVEKFERYLEQSNALGILPTEEILRNATDWKRCRAESPFTVPPENVWQNVVTTLKFIGTEIISALGPVHAVSGYRVPTLNRCAHGGKTSAHLEFYALDIIPEKQLPRNVLISLVCKIHSSRGSKYSIGLGFYDGLRFHIDSKQYRRWGPNFHSNTSPCLKSAG